MHIKYNFLSVKAKDNNGIIGGQKFFDQPVKNNLKTYDNIGKLQLVKEIITRLAVY